MIMRHDHQQIIMKSDCTIAYDRGTIVLSGAPAAVHREGDRILRRFAHSARPYEIKNDTPGRIVLERLHEAGPAQGVILKWRTLGKGVKA
jgi:hypothetical protein